MAFDRMGHVECGIRTSLLFAAAAGRHGGWQPHEKLASAEFK